MFSAVQGLGAGGTQDTQLSDTANGVLYGCFAIAGFFAGSVNVRSAQNPPFPLASHRGDAQNPGRNPADSAPESQRRPSCGGRDRDPIDR